MPVKTPGRRAGSGSALRQIKRALETKTSRTLSASLNLTSMVDFMSVVVIFLLMNFSASGEVLFNQKDLVIPIAVQSEPLERVPVLAISASAIMLEGKPIEDPSLVLAQAEGYEFAGLITSLNEQKEKFKTLHPGTEFDQKIIIQADQDVPYILVRRVVETAAAQGYALTYFAVRQKGEEK